MESIELTNKKNSVEIIPYSILCQIQKEKEKFLSELKEGGFLSSDRKIRQDSLNSNGDLLISSAR